jgi:DNA-binding CsgD family transcriptional regulator
VGLQGSQRASIERRIAQLSDGQRECLFLVGQMHNSKEIARLVGRSPHTVDERLKRAVAVLEVGSRFEAARLYLDHLQAKSDAPQPDPATHQSLVYQRTGVQHPYDRHEAIATFADDPAANDGGTHELREAQAAYAAGTPMETYRAFDWASVLDGSQRNRLPANLRLAAIALIAVLAIFGFGVLVSIAEGLSRLT